MQPLFVGVATLLLLAVTATAACPLAMLPLFVIIATEKRLSTSY